MALSALHRAPRGARSEGNITARKQPDIRRDQGKTGEDTTGTATGARGQPPGGKKDARGLTVDGSGFGEEQDTPNPGNAAEGPWAVHPEPKGD
jgi:hypothetical protein